MLIGIVAPLFFFDAPRRAVINTVSYLWTGLTLFNNVSYSIFHDDEKKKESSTHTEWWQHQRSANSCRQMAHDHFLKENTKTHKRNHCSRKWCVSNVGLVLDLFFFFSVRFFLFFFVYFVFIFPNSLNRLHASE